MTIIDNAKLFVIDFFKNNEDPKCTYHTFKHTFYVANKVEFIGKQEALSEKEIETLIIAAWFHDTGHLVQKEDHENASIEIFHTFCKKHEIDDTDFIKSVESCILTTNRKNAPKNTLEKVIMDADVSHIGDENFIEISKRLKKELENFSTKPIATNEYWLKTLKFLETQQFYTPTAQRIFNEIKAQNIKKVNDIINKKSNSETNKAKKKSPSRGIESMFRLTANNQMRLTSIADKKANILISINSILISVSAAIASTQLITPLNKIMPATVVLFLSSLFSLIFAILSCRPQLSSWKYSKDDIKKRKVNLLFFGNFHKIPYQEYEDSVKEMMEDYDFLYSSLIKDQHSLGLSLNRKYKLLRSAYSIFMYGFILAAITFVVSYFLSI